MHLFRMHFFVDRISSGFLKKSLHDILSFDIIVKQCPGGEIGRRSGLKIHRSLLLAGSNPATGTNKPFIHLNRLDNLLHVGCFFFVSL